MYEILAGMDAFITDYSSAAFDASEADIPVFIYADDIEKYMNDRGSLLWELSDDTEKTVSNNPDIEPDINAVLPFLIAINNHSLEANILNFDMAKYFDMLYRFRTSEKLVCNTKASKLVADVILEKMHI